LVSLGAYLRRLAIAAPAAIDDALAHRPEDWLGGFNGGRVAAALHSRQTSIPPPWTGNEWMDRSMGCDANRLPPTVRLEVGQTLNPQLQIATRLRHLPSQRLPTPHYHERQRRSGGAADPAADGRVDHGGLFCRLL
jgi:hypothetical protein